MNKLIWILALSSALFAEEQTTSSKVLVAEAAPIEAGLNLGWGVPYGGLSLQVGYNVTPSSQIQFAGGISSSGYRIGGGYLHYIFPEATWTPIAGVSVARASGLPFPGGQVTLNNETAWYSVNPGFVASPRLGLCYQGTTVSFQTRIGYNMTVSGGEVVYQYGTTGSASNKQLRDVAELAMSPTGIEISMGLYFRL